jgi:predicted TIM-barrel fold metal-dependent hydrolase
LVKACRQALWSTSGGAYNTSNASGHGDLLLVHEATFQDEEQEEAEKKKHSTISEAMQVAADIPATRVLLTHFSQRYVSLTNTNATAASNNSSSSSERRIPMGFAMDGLWLPLSNNATTK